MSGIDDVIGPSHDHFPRLSRRDAMVALGGAAFASGFAKAGTPAAVIGAAQDAGGAYRIGEIDGRLDGTGGAVAPMRLHALCPRPDRLEAVAIARRPGDLALVLDGDGRSVRASFRAGDGHRFSGHGVYVDGGAKFLTTEIDHATGAGVVTLRDVGRGYEPVGAFDSGGVGPHELIPSGRLVAVANGAKEPKGDPGIAALDRTPARSNLVLMDAATGAVDQVAEPSAGLETLSLRHLAQLPGGGVLVAAQDREITVRDRPLVFRLDGGRLQPFDEAMEVTPRFCAYVGSLSVDRSGRFVAASSPKGGVVAVFDAATGSAIGAVAAPDVCGLAPAAAAGRFVATTGLGDVLRIAVDGEGCAVVERRSGPLRWDNHLAALG